MIAQNSIASIQQASNMTGPTFGVSQVAQVCEQVLEVKKSQYAETKRATLVLGDVRTFEIPVQVLIAGQDLVKIFAACIDHSVHSLGAGEGIVRTSIVTGLRQVTITIEDNGFGMSEERLALAERTQNLSFTEMRAMIAFWGGKLTRNARLGVGSRVIIELPRIDFFAREIVPQVPYKNANALINPASLRG